MVDGWERLPGESAAEYKERTDKLLAKDFTNDTEIDGYPEKSNQASNARAAKKEERAPTKQRKSEAAKAARRNKK